MPVESALAELLLPMLKKNAVHRQVQVAKAKEVKAAAKQRAVATQLATRVVTGAPARRTSGARRSTAIGPASSLSPGQGGKVFSAQSKIPAAKVMQTNPMTGKTSYGKVDPYAPQTTVDWNGADPGGSLTVNSSASKRFTDFLSDLRSTGYNPQSVAGYNVRNIAGTNTPSLHSYGLAIDIDPGANGVQYGDQFSSSMPSNVESMARKYGLEWGGAWNGSKKDPMHFSYPMFGRK